MEPLAALRRDHRLLLSVLDSFDAWAPKIQRGADPAHLARFVRFLRAFLDNWHHPKEEQVLLATMQREGAYDTDLAALLDNDHSELRALLGNAARLADDIGGATPLRVQAAVAVLLEVASLLRHHIEVEETVVFPMAEGELPARVLPHVERSLRAMEIDPRRSFLADPLRKLADSLVGLQACA